MSFRLQCEHSLCTPKSHSCLYFSVLFTHFVQTQRKEKGEKIVGLMLKTYSTLHTEVHFHSMFQWHIVFPNPGLFCEKANWSLWGGKPPSNYPNTELKLLIKEAINLSNWAVGASASVVQIYSSWLKKYWVILCFICCFHPCKRYQRLSHTDIFTCK